MQEQSKGNGIARFSVELPYDLGERLSRIVYASEGKETKKDIIRRGLIHELDKLEKKASGN